jgi:uncharacterized membrane protein YfcA
MERIVPSQFIVWRAKWRQLGRSAYVQRRMPEPALATLREMKSTPSGDYVLNIAGWFTMALLAAITSYFFARLFASGEIALVNQVLASGAFWSAVGVGFVAQVIDGALGMAYGVTATTFLLSAGATPAMASASVHIAEIFTTGFSGVSHVKFGNVNRQLFIRLLIPGIIGGILGVLFVTQVDSTVLKPYVTAYLLLMGVYIISKAFRKLRARTAEPRHVGKLAVFGGFVDAAGGGGWGPVVTSTLVGSGRDPRTTIGSVNFAEFFITVATATSFTVLLGPSTWQLVAGLVVGGLFAAPFAALLCKRLSARLMLVMVGTLITALSGYNLYRALS